MKDEALKLALEALWTTANPKAEEAITAIKAALAAQPAHVISEKEQLKQWIATTNYYRAKREYEPDAAQPVQEPVSVTYKEVADAMNSLWNGTLKQHQIAEQMANKKLYTTPQQRPWVGLTLDERYECIHGESVDAWDIAEAIEAKLKELNT